MRSQQIIVSVLLCLALPLPAFSQATADDAAALSAWKVGAQKTAIGNQLITILNSTNNVLKYTPKHARSLYMRGYLYGVVGCTTSAIADLTKAIEADPALAAAYTERGICYMDMRDFTRARADLDRAVQLDPRSGDARFARGKLLLETDRPSSALSDLASCQNLTFAPALPGELPANYYNAPEYYLGSAYEALGRPDMAIKYYKSSIRSPRLGGSGYLHRYSNQPLDAASKITVYESQ